MIEPIMYIGIGFLVAGLLVIGVIPLVHARAVRLTMRRLEALTPLSMAEIQAEKDQLRAGFAMSMRRLEITVEQLKAKVTNQLTEIGRKSEAIGRLKLELGEKSAALFALEAREKQLVDDLEAHRSELAARMSQFEENERALATTQAQLADTNAGLNDRSVTLDSQRVELMALQAQIEAFKGQIESSDQEIKDLQSKLGHKAAESKALGAQLAEERGKSDQLGTRLGELERQLIVQTTDRDVLGRRLQELNGRIEEQARLLADRDSAAGRLRDEAAAAQKTGAEVRAALAEAENRHRLAIEAVKAKKARVEEQLRQAREEGAKLEREIATIKREADSASSNEQMENAVLRERINDVAAEVARLTATLEGAASPINAILGSDPPSAAAHAGNGANGSDAPPIAPAGSETRRTLADRIRALQSRAARALPTSGA